MAVLNWLSRKDDLHLSENVPFRVLREVPELGCPAENNCGILVQGDNLEALKSLLPFYAGQVKCIYIDPPYNTKLSLFYLTKQAFAGTIEL